MEKKNRLAIIGLIILSIITLWYPHLGTISILIIYCFSYMMTVQLKYKKAIDHYKQNLKSAEKQVEVQQSASVMQLEQIFNAIPSPLVYINAKGDFEIVNNNFEILLGETIKSVFDTHIPKEIRRILLDGFLNETQQVVVVSYNNIDYQSYVIPIMVENRYAGCIVVFQDVTRITEIQKTQKRFIADASNELSKPIHTLKKLEDELYDNNKEDAWEIFDTQINHLKKIVEELLLQSKFNENKVHLEMSTFNLYQMLDGLVHELRKEIHDKQVKVVINCPSNLMVYGDHLRLRQVFLNLFYNSLNYVPNKTGQISIVAKEKGKDLDIKFIDNGSGIKPEIIDSIFDRFFQGTKFKDNVGAGLGLAISKQIMKAHNGDLTVKSTPNVETIFTAKLENKN